MHKSYKGNELLRKLCEGYLDMPCGCEGCPLGDDGEYDDEGNFVCELELYLREERNNES